MWGWFAGIAAAQDVTGGQVPDLNAQTFRPSIDGDRLLWVDDGGKRPDQAFVGRFLLQYVADPLVYRTADDEVTHLVSSVFQADLLGGWQLGPARLGVDVPVYIYAASDVAAADGQAGLGDLAVDGKVTVLDGRSGPGASGASAPIDVALNARVGFPTATVQTALGSPDIGWEVAAIASRELGPVLLAANLGTRGGPQAELENIVVNDFFSVRLAANYAFNDDAGAGPEFSWQVPYSASMANTAGWPLEVLASGYGYASGDVVVRGGVGRGLSPGIGSPDLRIVLGVGYEPRAGEGPVDTDGDGLVDTNDQCPTEPEDADGFEDKDGCPDPDNDQDGILDVDDGCDDDPEDKDGWKDEDGCPEDTTVKVLVFDKETKQPLDVGRVQVVCGEVKKSGTSPADIEVPPGPCSVQATAAGYLRAEVEVDVGTGPPIEVKLEIEKQQDAAVTVTRKQVELKESIRFETGRAAIKPESFGVLDQAVQIMKDYPEIKLLRIEAHADERGPDDFNLKLSKERAAAVVAYFVKKGVERSRLESEGYGETRPLDPGHTEAAWAKNRRTDFFVQVWEAQPVQTAPAPAPAPSPEPKK